MACFDKFVLSLGFLQHALIGIDTGSWGVGWLIKCLLWKLGDLSSPSNEFLVKTKNELLVHGELMGQPV